MTRLTSRAWKRNTSRPSASFSTLAPGPSVQLPESAHWLRSTRPARRSPAARRTRRRSRTRSSALARSRGRSRGSPASSSRPAPRSPRRRPRPGAADVVVAGLPKQHLDGHLALLVAALAKVHVSDLPFGVRDVHGRPVVVVEGAPDREVGVERDRIVDSHVIRGPADVVGVPLERELGRVDADDDQALSDVLLVPPADVAERAQPVDARVRPEVDEDDLPAQAFRGQRLGVEPAGRARRSRAGGFRRGAWRRGSRAGVVAAHGYAVGTAARSGVFTAERPCM